MQSQPEEKGKEKEAHQGEGEKELKRRHIDETDVSFNLEKCVERANSGDTAAQEKLVEKCSKGYIDLDSLKHYAGEKLMQWSFLSNYEENDDIAYFILVVFNPETIANKFPQLLESIHKRAVDNNPLARINFASMCVMGLGVEKNNEEFVKQLMLAATDGFPKAQTLLGCILYNGQFIHEKNEKKAMQLLQNAADQGYGYAHYKLGDWYSKGLEDLPKDDHKTIKHYQKALDLGDHRAYAALADLYYDSEARDLPKALHMHLRASKTNPSAKSKILGRLAVKSPSSVTQTETVSFQGVLDQFFGNMSSIIADCDVGRQESDFDTAFKKGYPVPGEMESYTIISDYATNLLNKVIKLQSVSPGFLVTLEKRLFGTFLLESQADLKEFKTSKEVRVTTRQEGREETLYLTFGEKNVEALDELQTLPDFQPVEKAIKSLTKNLTSYGKQLEGESKALALKCQYLEKASRISELAEAAAEQETVNKKHAEYMEMVYPQVGPELEKLELHRKILYNLSHQILPNIHRLGLVGRNKEFKDEYGLQEVQ